MQHASIPREIQNSVDHNSTPKAGKILLYFFFHYFMFSFSTLDNCKNVLSYHDH